MGTPKFTPEQDQAIRCIEKNVVVSAGAGSGKTRVLVERFLYILEQGLQEADKNVSPRTILAVTFTRKAATEMRDRIRRKLMEKIEKRGMESEGMEQYLSVFKHGMPPHGGLGIGLERLTMKLVGEDNVRETTLFPRDLSRLEP